MVTTRAKISESLRETLYGVEKEIKLFIQENSFYLPFEQKGWACSPMGQKLMALTASAINLGYLIDDLERLGL